MVVTVLKPLLVGLLLAAVLAKNDNINDNRKKFNVQMKVMPYDSASKQPHCPSNGDHAKTLYQKNGSELGGGIIVGERIPGDKLLMLDIIMLDRVYPTAMSLLWTAEFHVKYISEISVLNVGDQNATVDYVSIWGGETKKVEIEIKFPISAKLNLTIYGVRYLYDQ